MNSGFIVNGTLELAPGLQVSNWLDNPVLRLKRGEDGTSRDPDTWLRVVVLHTTKGIAGGAPLQGFGPSVKAGERVARYWFGDGRKAGAHLVIDQDGTVSCLADLVLETAWHCPKWNGCSIGVEIYQGAAGELYEGQLDVTVRVCDWLTRRFGVQRQIPHRYLGPIDRFLPGDESVVGIIGHRDAARDRGAGDPGNAIFNRLYAAGYEAHDFDQRHDLEAWRRRQTKLGLQPDGIPGPRTVAKLRETGRPNGLWVPRPGDDPAPRVV